MFFSINFGFCVAKVYPKVKVRQQQEHEEDPLESMRIFSLKDFQSLSLYDHPSNSPSPEHKDSYTPPHVRVHISDAKISVKTGKEVSESNRKASSVLPPRAVLSSPENDSMHGTKSKTQGSGSKNHNLCRNRHAKCTKSYELERKRPSWK